MLREEMHGDMMDMKTARKPHGNMITRYNTTSMTRDAIDNAYVLQ